MHLLMTQAGEVARQALDQLAAARRAGQEVDPDRVRRLRHALRGRFEMEDDPVALEALALFEQDADEYRLPVLVVLANKLNHDAGYLAHLQELVSDVE